VPISPSGWDGDLADSGELVGVARKKFGLIPDVQRSTSETLPVSSGTQQVPERVVSDDVSAQETLRTDVYVVTLAKAEPVSDRFGPLP